MNEQAATINHAKDALLDLAIRFGPRLLTAIVILLVGLGVSRWLSNWLATTLNRRDLEPPIRLLVIRLVWVACIAMFVIMALQNLGVELLPLIAGLGVAGAGLALATQGVLSNIVAGLTIIFSKPFRVGEYIAIAGVEGVVESITLFNTSLGHVDHSHVIVPNRKIVGEILHNYGSIRQVEVSVAVAYDTDLAVPTGLIREVLAANARVLKDPAPLVQAARLGESAVSISVKAWVLVQDQVATPGELNAALLELLRARGVVMPFPQREVRLIGTPA
ncbi:MAG TPA: mechanosensitive ion channel [Steroidobacteraceae bacterium]|jgi:small conductance mechanosensitive channel|nr:mechanosensitive ion channel [Steroidobacteraceae bacterium]